VSLEASRFPLEMLDRLTQGVKRPADQRRTAFLTLDNYRALGAALKGAERSSPVSMITNPAPP